MNFYIRTVQKTAKELPNGQNKMHYLRLIPSFSDMVVVIFSETSLICIEERERVNTNAKELKAQKMCNPMSKYLPKLKFVVRTNILQQMQKIYIKGKMCSCDGEKERA